jgi:hypothetical protein
MTGVLFLSLLSRPGRPEGARRGDPTKEEIVLHPMAEVKREGITKAPQCSRDMRAPRGL